MKYCYFNGKIILEKNVKISIDDVGFLRGYSVFDVMVSYNGKPFLLKKHFERLKNSANNLNLKFPATEKKFESIILTLLNKNNIKNVSIRSFLTGGGVFFIRLEKPTKLAENLYKTGAKIITLNYFRYLPEAKTSNYISSIRQMDRMKKEKAMEILYTYDGKVLECSTSNFFLIKNGVIITPKDGVLGGVTRYFILKIARENGFAVEERDIKVTELKTSDEAFLTATNKEIVPVVKIDKLKIGKGKVGVKTKELMELFSKYATN